MFYDKNKQKMKKLIKYIFAFAIGSLMLNSCEDPYAGQIVAEPGAYDQATLQSTTFTVALKSGVSPLAIQVGQLSTQLALLTCTATPIPLDTNAVVSYELQLSKTNTFVDYVVMPSVFSGTVNSDVKINFTDLNVQLLNWKNEVTEQNIYVRLVAYITRNGLKTSINSDALAFKVTPYKNPLKSYTEVTPKPYFIIGMANGGWNNSASGLGVSIYPMTVVPGLNFNAAGNGLFTYTGYFWASRGFKLIRDLGNWDEQWGKSGSAFVHNDGGSSDIKVAADGYYTITLNSVENTMTMVPATVTPVSYSKIGLIGGFNGWSSDIVMSPCEASNNHNWYATVTFTGDDQGKFRANGGWDVNWGTPSDTADGDPLYMFTGIGKGNGKNIGVKAGTYVVLFNDIDGGYWFFKQ